MLYIFPYRTQLNVVSIILLSHPLLCFQHGWRRRSLIEDAKFDTVTNAELEKQNKRTSSSSSDHRAEELPEEEAGDAEGAFPEHRADDTITNGGPASSPLQTTKFPVSRCCLLLGLRDSAGLSSVFAILEVFFRKCPGCPF